MCTKLSGKAKTTSLTAGLGPPKRCSPRCDAVIAYRAKLTVSRSADANVTGDAGGAAGASTSSADDLRVAGSGLQFHRLQSTGCEPSRRRPRKRRARPCQSRIVAMMRHLPVAGAQLKTVSPD